MDLTQILTSPWTGPVGIVIGIVCTAIGIRKGRRLPKPYFAESSTKWFDSDDFPHENLELHFKGKNIKRFVVSHLAFWNAGSAAIRPEDFISENPLAIMVTGPVLDIRVISETAPDLGIKLHPTNAAGRIPVTFNYLDQGDGFVVQIIHESQFSPGVGISGKIPGIKSFAKGNYPSQAVEPQQSFKSLFFESMTTSIPVTAAIFIALFAMRSNSIVATIIVAFAWFFCLGCFGYGMYRFNRRNMPPKAILRGSK